MPGATTDKPNTSIILVFLEQFLSTHSVVESAYITKKKSMNPKHIELYPWVQTYFQDYFSPKYEESMFCFKKAGSKWSQLSRLYHHPFILEFSTIGIFQTRMRLKLDQSLFKV